MSENRRMNKGRQKIDIVKMQNENNLQVTFSKRRAGLFKKASELCTLTGSEVAILVFSPGKKAYSFGCPTVNEILRKFESHPPHILNAFQFFAEARRMVSVLGLNHELGLLENQVEDEKQKSVALHQIMRANRGDGTWWQTTPIDELNSEQLVPLKWAYEELLKLITLERQTRILPPLPPESIANLYPNFSHLPVPSLNNFTLPSASSTFFPYYPNPPPPPPTVPEMPFAPFVGPSSDTTGATGSGVPLIPFGDANNETGFGGAGMPSNNPFDEFFINRG